jgi:hypothetical protein
MLVEAPASNIVVYSVTSLCSPTVVASDALSLFQFWGSDALVVSAMIVQQYHQLTCRQDMENVCYLQQAVEMDNATGTTLPR